jgi:hypothetical protein
MNRMAVIVLGALIAGTAGAAEPAKGIDACTLLAEAEVSAAMGLQVEKGVRRDSGRTDQGAYSSTCLWRVAADKDVNDPTKPLHGARFAILNVQHWDKGSAGPKTFLNSFRAAADEHIIKNKPVALKIGDESIWWGDGVAVRKGDVSFGMSVHLVTEREKERGMAEDLATKVLKKL